MFSLVSHEAGACEESHIVVLAPRLHRLFSVALRNVSHLAGRRMTFEWALIHGKNDSIKTAEELGRLLAPLKGMCHVNIIPLNPTTGTFALSAHRPYECLLYVSCDMRRDAGAAASADRLLQR